MKLKYITLCLLLINGIVFGQQNTLKRANAKFNNLSYVEAISLYSNLVNDGYGTPAIFENLANAYYYQSNYDLAKSIYDSLFKRTQDIPVNTYYKYINVLRSQGAYKQADIWYKKMLDVYPNEKQVIRTNQGIFLNSKVTSTPVILKNTSINSKYLDYKAAYLGDNELVFTSTRSTKKFFTKKSTWNNQAYTNLYKSQIINEDSLSGVEKLKGSINKYYNESSAVFTKDGTTMYFTRNNHNSLKVVSDSLNNVLLKIYKATFNGKKWGNVEELPFNSNDFSCAHPALSPEEDYLYFSSDMPGTQGESDLYRVSIKENTFGNPENLGAKINTKGRDTFPFISSDNVLIFASDYREGLGGLDLYYVNLNSSTKRVYSFSAPINSVADDFGLVYKAAQGNGYLTSNREEESVGNDDIYQFKGLKLPEMQDITLIFKSNKGTPLVGATKVLFTGNKTIQAKPIALVDQKLPILDIDISKEYTLEVSNDNYEPLTATLGYKGKDTITIILTEKAPPPAPVDLQELLKLENIYFDFDKYAIRKDAAVELAKILEILNKYPVIELEIIGHTDSFGPAVYNERLSAQRAASTKQWLVGNGISSDRITTFGYGEKQPINDCATKKCTREQHDQNRRTEFLIKQ